MEPKTLEALKASIAKWERNVEAETPGDASTSEISCPLCRLFIVRECIQCPVRQKTGKSYCRGTPYIQAASRKSSWAWGNGKAEDFRAAAQTEVDFLKSLLPVEA